MRPQLAVVIVLFFLGCAQFEKGALVTMVALADGRAQSAVAVTKADHVKQADFRTRARATTTLPALDALEAEYKKYNENVDKALTAFDKMGQVIKTLKDALKAGTKLDLKAALDAYKELSKFVGDLGLGVQLPQITGVN